MSEMGFCFKGASIVNDFGKDQLLEKNGKKFAKIFLISTASNINKWRVHPETIPDRIKTFKGRPYISEPNLEHFNAEKMSPEQILKVQESFVAGIIREVVVKDDLTGFAIVEFNETPLGKRTWREMKDGNAIYSSPAIAGRSVMVGGERLFLDWYGLHLARVKDPAYGVFHASIKETCEGDHCLNHLVSTASANQQENSSIILTNTSSKTMSTETDKIKQLEEQLATANSKIAEHEKALADAKTALEAKEKASTAATDEDVDCDANPEHPKCRENATSSKKTDKVDAKEFAKMQAVIAAYEQKEKQTVIDQIVDMKATAGIIDDKTEAGERENLSKLSMEALTAKQSELSPIVDKLVELANASGRGNYSTDGRTVTMPPTAFASASKKQLPRNLNDLNGDWS